MMLISMISLTNDDLNIDINQHNLNHNYKMTTLKSTSTLINCLKGCHKLLREKLMITIDSLFKIGVLKKATVTHRLNLFSNMVTVKKTPSNLRLCIDLIDLNSAIIHVRQHYQMQLWAIFYLKYQRP